MIDGRNFYDQPINDFIKQYDEVRKVSTLKGDDYTTGCLLDYACLMMIMVCYKLITADLSKQKGLDADPRAIQQIIFQRGDGYTSLLDYAYFKDNYRLIAADLSKEKALDAHLIAIQQIVFQRVVGGDDNTKIRLYTILEKSKEIVLEFYKETAKVL